MDKDRQRAKEQMKALPFKEKMSNFWFYYKTHTIVLIIAMFVIAWSVVQCASRIDYDLAVSFYSEYYVPEENLAAFDEFLKSKIEDANENGSIDARAMLYTSEIDGEYLDQNAQALLMKLQAELASGETFSYMVDESFKTYLEKVLDDMEMMDTIIDISDAPIVKETLKLPEGKKLYWISLAEYENQKHDPDTMAKRKNVKAIETFFEENLKMNKKERIS